MNRNVTIVVIILVLVAIAGYLVWLRSRYQPQLSPQTTVEETSTPQPTMTPEETASPSATPAVTKEATGSMKEKPATKSPNKR